MINLENWVNWIISGAFLTLVYGFFKLYNVVKGFDHTEKIKDIDKQLITGKQIMDKHTEQITNINSDIRVLSNENQNHKLLHEDIKDQVGRIEDKIDMLLNRSLK